MDLEVFEGAETVEEAIAAAKQARMCRFLLYVDLQTDGKRLSLLSHYSPDEQHKYNNQINQAMNARGGFPEYLARRIEEVLGLPFGWLDQPYPISELRASRARAVRLLRRIEARGAAAATAVGKRRLEQIRDATKGERGVSKDLYEKVMKKLKLAK